MTITVTTAHWAIVLTVLLALAGAMYRLGSSIAKLAVQVEHAIARVDDINAKLDSHTSKLGALEVKVAVIESRQEDAETSGLHAMPTPSSGGK